MGSNPTSSAKPDQDAERRVTDGAALRALRTAAGLSQARLAEISGLAQHRLSAFERGAGELRPEETERLRATLADAEGVEKARRRPKRTRPHVHSPRPQDPERRARHQPTAGNPEYLRELARLEKKPQAEFSALSLFAGCGGMSLGAQAAGFAVRGFVEIDEELAALYAANFPEARRIGRDVRKLGEGETAKLLEACGPVDLLLGGPPCQGFSLTGKRQAGDPRNALFREYLRVLRRVRPKFAMLENVARLTSMRGASGEVVGREIAQGFREAGYEVRACLLDAQDFGVPQHRERVFFLAADQALGRAPEPPRPSHGAGAAALRSFGDACSDLQYLEAGEAGEDPLHRAVAHPDHVLDWLWDAPQGKSAHDNPDPAQRPPSGYNTTYKRQIWNQPAATVQTTFGMISGSRNVHPIATRALTVREAARLQSFPDSFRFFGKLGAIRTGIGNATPPLLAKAVAEAAAQELRKSTTRLKA